VTEATKEAKPKRPTYDRKVSPEVSYFAGLEKRFGHPRNVDPKTLSDEELVTLGKALNQESKLVFGGGSTMIIKAQLLSTIRELQDDPEDCETIDRAINIATKLSNIGYNMVHEGADTREQNILLIDEMWVLQKQVVAIAEEHEGDLRQKWLEYAGVLRKEIHHWCNHDVRLHEWLSGLRTEFQKRQPGYKEKTIQEIMEEEAAEAAATQAWIDAMDEEEEPEPYTDEEIMEMMHEEEIRGLQQRYAILQTLYDRMERIALGEEEASREQILALREDNRNITSDKYTNNADWRPNDRENIRLLTQVAKPEGHTFTIYYKKSHFHFTRNLCLRYGINITHRQQIAFHCTRLAWANNYWGYIEGFEDKGEVIISLWLSKQNKGDAKVPDFESDDAYDYFFDYYNANAKTALIAKQHGDRYLELERKIAPLNADFTGYTTEQLLEKHKLIMAELHKS